MLLVLYLLSTIFLKNYSSWMIYNIKKYLKVHVLLLYFHL